MLSKQIIKWYQLNKRDLPWRNTNDPYKIWLSEIILQQTRVDQGLPYYLTFITKFETVNELAEAEESEVLRTWQGLGYYSRARNLHSAAKFVVEECQGVFPKSYKDLLKLKGVGAYTAAAISSISYGEAKAVVDGNVYRVLSRIYEIHTPVNSSNGIREFSELAQSLIDHDNPADFNQGMMELGATVCSPKNPSCEVCPVQIHCGSFKAKSQKAYPVKLKKTSIKNRFFNYLVLKNEGKYFLEKREKQDIWKGLYEFYLIETENKTEVIDDLKSLFPEWMSTTMSIGTPIFSKQILTHQRIHTFFWPIELKNIPQELRSFFYKLEDIEQLPKHKLIEKYILDITIE